MSAKNNDSLSVTIGKKYFNRCCGSISVAETEDGVKSPFSNSDDPDKSSSEV